jgi:endonuclease/exonuclease/phosphatase family metal-dependent hydrolase
MLAQGERAMTSVRRGELLAALLLAALLAGCGGSDVARVFSQNTGTTPYMDAVAESGAREICEQWYDNNLCTLDSEALLAEEIAGQWPDVVLLQEVWDQARCDDPERPAEADEAPFACSASGSQLDRVLPEGYAWACSGAYPDNCVAWLEDVVTSGAPALRDLASDCEPAGRVAALSAQTSSGEIFIAVLHTTAGYTAGDQDCRISQLEALAEALAALPPETAVIVGGDVNHDAGSDSDDAAAFSAMLDAGGLRRLEDDGDTAVLLGADLDAVATRGVLEGARCAVRSLDAGASEPMFDHALLDCR